MPSPFCLSEHNTAPHTYSSHSSAAFLSEWVYMGEGSAAFPFCVSAHNPAALTHSSHPSAAFPSELRMRGV